MKKLFLVLMAMSLLTYPVLAEEIVCPDGHECPEPSPEFGQHISDMTQTCLGEHGGQMFGHCVSGMAVP